MQIPHPNLAVVSSTKDELAHWLLLDGPELAGSFHVKSTQKMDDPSGFSSNLVRPMHIQSNLATPNFYPIREVFLELWSVESAKF